MKCNYCNKEATHGVGRDSIPVCDRCYTNRPKLTESQLKQIEEVKGKLTKILSHYAISFEVDGRYSEKPYVAEIMELAEIAILDKDQSLPDIRPHDPYRTQSDILSAHFQRTIEKTT